mgnify:CR=1 FL=1
MGRIYYLLGKSATGKDTLYKEILKRRPKLRTVTMYTTRPIREGETDGVEYFFTGREELERQLASGKVIESRTYQTIAGPWTYYTVDDGQFNVADDESCLMIGTLESYEKMCTYFESGKDRSGLYRRSRTGSGFSGPSNARKTRKSRITGKSAGDTLQTKKIFQRKIWNAWELQRDIRIRIWKSAWKKS